MRPFWTNCSYQNYSIKPSYESIHWTYHILTYYSSVWKWNIFFLSSELFWWSAQSSALQVPNWYSKTLLKCYKKQEILFWYLSVNTCFYLRSIFFATAGFLHLFIVMKRISIQIQRICIPLLFFKIKPLYYLIEGTKTRILLETRIVIIIEKYKCRKPEVLFGFYWFLPTQVNQDLVLWKTHWNPYRLIHAFAILSFGSS